ncbi:uncharacterized protein LOC125032810 [Penaeus chinensis]|uniref:uncharacterized protein LOC125032810 n=1 Tax=Penaeus chinensis TaxID=139456 RepID=UPI001FB750A2|nr:uncharacterized protein LOC125032810 [Penaeus chinensis]
MAVPSDRNTFVKSSREPLQSERKCSNDLESATQQRIEKRRAKEAQRISRGWLLTTDRSRFILSSDAFPSTPPCLVVPNNLRKTRSTCSFSISSSSFAPVSMWRFGLALLGGLAFARAQHGVEEPKDTQILESRQGLPFVQALNPNPLLGFQNPLQQLLLGQNPLLQELQGRQNFGIPGAGILPGLASLTGLANAPGMGLLQLLVQGPQALNRLGALSLGVSPLAQLAALRQQDLNSRLQQGPGLFVPGRSGEDQESVKDLINLAQVLGVGGPGDFQGADGFGRNPSYFSERKGTRDDDLSTLLQRLNAYSGPARALRFPRGESTQGLLSESGLGSSRYLQELTGLERSDARSSSINRIGSVESQPIFVRERRRQSAKTEDSGENFRFPNYS